MPGGLGVFESVIVLLARAPGLGDPTHGFVAGRQFQFIANSGWDRVKEDGSLGDAVTATPAELWRLRLPATPSLRRRVTPSCA